MGGVVGGKIGIHRGVILANAAVPDSDNLVEPTTVASDSANGLELDCPSYRYDFGADLVVLSGTVANKPPHGYLEPGTQLGTEHIPRACSSGWCIPRDPEISSP